MSQSEAMHFRLYDSFVERVWCRDYNARNLNNNLPEVFMKKLVLSMVITAAAAAAFAGSAFARDVWVNGYTRSDGTEVRGHYRSAPDSSYNNNWSTEGNVNPYTGESGTRERRSY